MALVMVLHVFYLFMSIARNSLNSRPTMCKVWFYEDYQTILIHSSFEKWHNFTCKNEILTLLKPETFYLLFKFKSDNLIKIYVKGDILFNFVSLPFFQDFLICMSQYANFMFIFRCLNTPHSKMIVTDLFR